MEFSSKRAGPTQHSNPDLTFKNPFGMTFKNPFSIVYCGLRNEAFCKMEAKWEPLLAAFPTWSKVEDYLFPPNDAGWNAAGHDCPFVVP